MATGRAMAAVGGPGVFVCPYGVERYRRHDGAGAQYEIQDGRRTQ